MLRFTPKKEEEFSNLLQPGYYQFQVINAEDHISDKGNDTIKITLKIWDRNNKERIVVDYLVDNYKLKHFCDATDMVQKYQEGCISSLDCRNKSGTLKLTIQKDKAGKYGDKNSVVDYLVPKVVNGNETIVDTKKASVPFFDDEIPFI